MMDARYLVRGISIALVHSNIHFVFFSHSLEEKSFHIYREVLLYYSPILLAVTFRVDPESLPNCNRRRN